MVIPDFISPEEEAFILSHLSTPKKSKGGRRSAIRRYGTKVYLDNYVGNIPEHFTFLQERLEPHVGHKPKSITTNTYLPGDSIKPHIDLGNELVSVISLLSPAEMVLSKGKEKIQLTLPPRSLLLLRDEYRFQWKHEILPVEALRYSIVFRD